MKVKAHKHLIGRVVDELIDNAVKYTEQGSIMVLAERSGNHARITVADTGRGMSWKDRFKACWLFYRSPDAIDKPGDGLGLTTVKAIVKGHYHGKLRIKSKLGEGTTVTVTLPRYFV